MGRIVANWRQWTPQPATLLLLGALIIVFLAGLGAGGGLTRHTPTSQAAPVVKSSPWRVVLTDAGVGIVNGADIETSTTFTVTARWRVVVPEQCDDASTQTLDVTIVDATTDAQVDFLSVAGTCGATGQDGLAVATETAPGTFRLHVESAQPWTLTVQEMEAATR